MTNSPFDKTARGELAHRETFPGPHPFLLFTDTPMRPWKGIRWRIVGVQDGILLMLKPGVYCPLVVSFSSWVISGGAGLFQLDMPGSRKVGVAKGTNTTGNIFKGLRTCSVQLEWGTKMFWEGTANLLCKILWQVERSVISRLHSRVGVQ